MPSTELAQAHQRLLARRRLGASPASPPPPSPSHLDRLPKPLRQLSQRLTHASFWPAQWSTLLGREGTRPAFRVGQLDAELLDEELLELLRGQVADGLRYFDAHLRDDWSAEITLFLRAALFKLSIWDHDATYGATLQNLRYVDARRKTGGLTAAAAAPSRWQKGLYGAFSVGGRYARTKWEDWLVGSEVPSRTTRVFSRSTSLLTSFHSAAALLSFIVFLVEGRYRTLLDRILGLRLAPATDQVRRQISFEYLNRQLVWHAFTEFLLFVLPLVGIRRWRRWLTHAYRRVRSLVPLRRGPGDRGDQVPSPALSLLPERTCAICYREQNAADAAAAAALAPAPLSGALGMPSSTDITNPYEAIPCRCVYCFVCLASALEIEEGHGWRCLRCAALIKECRPWAGDVLVPELEREREREPAGEKTPKGESSIDAVVEGEGEGEGDPDGFQKE
ncbi:MAG: peroxisome assembly protein (Peroxin-2) [Phylliscum demangeonii]|nr:MAG: peroxisome assembly protein (Peroxin-2) [Phylliscum demangeonii]